MKVKSNLLIILVIDPLANAREAELAVLGSATKAAESDFSLQYLPGPTADEIPKALTA